MNNLKGIWLMAAGFAAFSVADVVAKVLTENFHPFQITWSRQLGIGFALVIILIMNGSAIFNSAVPKLQIVRGLFAAVSATCFIFAIRYVPLADVVAVTFVTPFLVTALGALVLKEKVGPRRWIAVSLGFLGTLVIIRPGFGVFHPAIFLTLVAALAFASRQIISRPIGKIDPTLTTLAYTATTALCVLSVPVVFVWVTPTLTQHLVLFIVLAIFSGAGEFLIIRALEVAEAVVVTPMHYTLIVYSTILGYLVFSELPDFWTFTGTGIVIGSGLYILYNERRRLEQQG